jgi:probable HAF family extracellular repeat protein
MTQLPTLGGANSQAARINSQGVVTGFAENQTPDLACPPPQEFQFKPVTWDKGKIQELPTLPGDPEGIANWNNDTAQVVGASGICATFNLNLGFPFQPIHALLWQNGTVTDLGNLGGTGHGAGIMASGINNLGQVVGFSDMPGDTSFQGFLWTKDKGMHPLGTLPGDVSSVAISNNDAGYVAGLSLDADFNPRAFLWQNGVMTDLNTLTPAEGSLFLLTACSINSSGQIIGLAMHKGTGELHGYLLSPRQGAAASVSPAAQNESGRMVLSEGVPELVRHWLAPSRFGRRLMGPR